MVGAPNAARDDGEDDARFIIQPVRRLRSSGVIPRCGSNSKPVGDDRTPRRQAPRRTCELWGEHGLAEGESECQSECQSELRKGTPTEAA